jgi:hypothetical protein
MKTGAKEAAGMNGLAATGRNHLIPVTAMSPDGGTITATAIHGARADGIVNKIKNNFALQKRAYLN